MQGARRPAAAADRDHTCVLPPTSPCRLLQERLPAASGYGELCSAYIKGGGDLEAIVKSVWAQFKASSVRKVPVPAGGASGKLAQPRLAQVKKK